MIELKSEQERAHMRAAGQVVAEVLQVLKAVVAPGLPTMELDRLADAEIKKRGAQSVFRGYQAYEGQPPYPATVCVSVNEQVVHGIPGSRRLKEGDLVSLDLGARVSGFVGDAALSVFVGSAPDSRAAELLAVTAASLDAGIAAVHIGGHVGDIGAAVQEVVEQAGFSVIRDFVGHGVGRSMHEDPQVPNYGTRGLGPRIRPGMALAIEPMVAEGGYAVRVLPDGWTAVTRDGSRACHFEHTLFVGEQGVEVLTRLSEEPVHEVQ
jgi:methionyl aminopeptidase